MTRWVLVLLVAALGLTAPSAGRAEMDPVLVRFHGSDSVACSFQKRGKELWKVIDPELHRSGRYGSIVFDQVDIDWGSARHVGQVGARSVALVTAPEYVAFLESSERGYVNTTVVHIEMDITEYDFIATTSRHVLRPDKGFIFELVEYHGACKVLR